MSLLLWIIQQIFVNLGQNFHTRWFTKPHIDKLGESKLDSIEHIIDPEDIPFKDTRYLYEAGVINALFAYNISPIITNKIMINYFSP